MLCFGTAIILAAAAPTPALADPPEIAVPDDGARPDGDPGEVGGDAIPSEGDTPVSGPGVSRGPYANKIAEQAKSVAELGEAANAAEEELSTRSEYTQAANDYWLELTETAEELNSLAADMAAENYTESAAGVQGVTDKFDALFEVNPGLLDYDETAIADEAETATADAAIAKTSLDAAVASQAIAANKHEDLAEELETDTKALEDLIEDNAEAIALQDQKAEADNQANYDLGDIGKDVDGLRAADSAQAAVEFAVGESGKPYEWGAEGPDSYDCSGLLQTAYGKQGVSIPRVAADQYRATSEMTVDVGKMLPGDLIFFGDIPGDWTSVYHVGMYIGNGEMVHAPRPGDVVKVAPVSFNDFFGAHRVVEAVEVESASNDTKSASTDSSTSAEPQEDAATRSDEPYAESNDSPTDDGGDPSPTPTPTPTPTG